MKKAAHGAAFLYCLRKGGGAYALLNIRPKERQDNDCGEWSREAREWAIRVGLFAGNGTTADGQPNYMWASPLTREQAAQLFYRFAQDHGLA